MVILRLGVRLDWCWFELHYCAGDWFSIHHPNSPIMQFDTSPTQSTAHLEMANKFPQV